ncbi:hypothetical protein [Sessilibacter corallicola]|uniref:hypothetical protein n=1 Tax=Sessilibacter corallicola TaxID=2904075 RepID=UPI001E413739|nr:hypothetical protein [Sessilibacter corallicola]MCE2029289.1 hypothetical protein [Sessilibacter corallicola]
MIPLNNPHVDRNSQLVRAIRTPKNQVNSGKLPESKLDIRDVEVRPATPKEINFIESGGERTIEVLNIYVRSGPLLDIENGDFWELSDRTGKYRAIVMDKRLASKRCKITISKIDD